MEEDGQRQNVPYFHGNAVIAPWHNTGRGQIGIGSKYGVPYAGSLLSMYYASSQSQPPTPTSLT